MLLWYTPCARCHVSINSPSEMNMKGGISIQRCLSGKCGVQQNGIDGSQQARFPLLIYGLPIVLDLGSSSLTTPIELSFACMLGRGFDHFFIKKNGRLA